MKYDRPNRLCYGIATFASSIAAALLFRRKFLRNEIKGAKGPFVVIANHETALDFVNLIGAAGRPMSFVISKSIYSTLPCKGFLSKLGLIPKQQFQTEISDLKKMKAVVNAGEPLVIYPAGLMCEDGLSTPIPSASYKFLKWMGVDVYVARSYGTYFVLPKWSGKLRPGRTYIDIYKLFDAEELQTLDVGTIRARTDEALLFDAYREQDGHRVRYEGGSNVEGLENVLYMCPHCGAEFSIQVRDKRILQCAACGYAQRSDEYAMLHRCSTHGPELRYVSDWNRLILDRMHRSVEAGELESFSSTMDVHMLQSGRNKFVSVGQAALSLSRSGFRIQGTINGDEIDMLVPVSNIPALPFSPGKYLEVQHGADIYRCVLHDGKQVIKFINLLKIFARLSSQSSARIPRPIGIKAAT